MFWFSVIVLTIIGWLVGGKLITKRFKQVNAEAQTESLREDARNEYLVAICGLVFLTPVGAAVCVTLWQIVLGLLSLAALVLSVVVFGLWLHKRYIAQ